MPISQLILYVPYLLNGKLLYSESRTNEQTSLSVKAGIDTAGHRVSNECITKLPLIEHVLSFSF